MSKLPNIEYNGRKMIVTNTTTSQDIYEFLGSVSLVVQYYRQTGRELFGFK